MPSPSRPRRRHQPVPMPWPGRTFPTRPAEELYAASPRIALELAAFVAGVVERKAREQAARRTASSQSLSEPIERRPDLPAA